MKLVCSALLSTLFIILVTFRVDAQQARERTFVSGQGTDSGNCSLVSPCRTLAYVFSQTAAGGEIVVLNTAAYGPLTITNAISITSPGVEAAISSASGENAITISAGTNDNVDLRGLIIDGGGIGTDGIHVTSAGNVNIVGCVVRNFTNAGIYVAAGKFLVQETFVSNSQFGFYIPEGSNFFGGLIRLSTFSNNAEGVYLFYSSATVELSNVTVSGSVIQDISVLSNSIMYLDRVAAGGVFNQSTVYSYGNNAIGSISPNAATPIALK